MTIADGDLVYGAYRRHDGVWHYSWGELVPEARDITVASLLHLLRPTTPELADVTVASGTSTQALVRRLEALEVLPAGTSGRVGPAPVDRAVVGMQAPELHIPWMVCVADVADVAGVSPATISAYRYRGYLPEPQAVVGRKPLWSRPVIAHWLATRPGAGWRTDMYGPRNRRRAPAAERRPTVGLGRHG